MSDRTVIISDVHLGRPKGAVRSADALRPIWRGAGRLILNGDSAEMHHPRFREHAAAALLRLVRLCEVDGVEVAILSGNHDPWVSADRHVTLAGGRVFVMHGDALHPAIAPWSAGGPVMQRAYEHAVAELAGDRPADLAARLHAARVASYTEWEALERQASRRSMLALLRSPLAVAKIIDYWRRVPRLAADFLADHAPDARFLVFGHTHRAGIWSVNGRTLINTGSFDFPSHPRAVVVDDATLSVHRIRRAGDQWRCDDAPLHRFEIGKA
jgi:UDP-2,3-diacylglucosamine pyrophosphatase LpxH